MSAFAPSEIIRADAVVHNVRAAGRLTPHHNGEQALLECIEAQQKAIMALGRMVADLQIEVGVLGRVLGERTEHLA